MSKSHERPRLTEDCVAMRTTVMRCANSSCLFLSAHYVYTYCLTMFSVCMEMKERTMWVQRLY